MQTKINIGTCIEELVHEFAEIYLKLNSDDHKRLADNLGEITETTTKNLWSLFFSDAEEADIQERALLLVKTHEDRWDEAVVNYQVEEGVTVYV